VNVTQTLKETGFASVEEMRLAALNQVGISFCTRHHFGTALPTEDQHYIRFAYSGIDLQQIEEGINILKKFIEDAITKKKSAL